MAYNIYIDELLNIEETSILAIFEQFQDKPWSILLDSCNQAAMGGRYDIIVHSPCICYEYRLGQHHLSGPWIDQNRLSIDTQLVDCPYELIKQVHEQFIQCFNKPSTNKKQIPYIVGAIGAFSYDLNTHSDNIIDENPDQYDMPDISIGFYSQSIVYDNVLNTLYVCSYDPLYVDQVRQFLQTSKLNTRQSFQLQSDWQANVEQHEYLGCLAQIHEYLLAGDCYQVNFAQRFHANYAGSEWDAYKKLREVNKAPFSSFIRLPKSSILSLSPERFLLVNNRNVQTKPIKGTRKRSTDLELDKALANQLLNAEKDKAENLMIVDLLRNDLSKYCQANSVNVPALFALESFPAVHHMVSTVEAKLKDDAKVYDLFKGAFPGGSITGAPKVRAMQIIQELEPDKRAIYCGSIAYFGINDDMDSNICIRTLLAEQNTLYCWAGGGIVFDSIAQDEYLESLHKVAKILPILRQTLVGEIA